MIASVRAVVTDEAGRAWWRLTNRGQWDKRRWYAARRVAALLPGVVVAQAVSRMIGETEQVHDPNPLAVPVDVYTRRWAERYPSCR